MFSIGAPIVLMYKEPKYPFPFQLQNPFYVVVNCSLNFQEMTAIFNGRCSLLAILTIAALIASQAMITAIFSCINQSISLGCFPRVEVIHTFRKFMGQIHSSDQLAFAVFLWHLLLPLVAYFRLAMHLVLISFSFFLFTLNILFFLPLCFFRFISIILYMKSVFCTRLKR